MAVEDNVNLLGLQANLEDSLNTDNSVDVESRSRTR